MFQVGATYHFISEEAKCLSHSNKGRSAGLYEAIVWHCYWGTTSPY